MHTRLICVLALATACTVHTRTLGATPDGDLYMSARRAFLGIPAKMHVLQCRQTGDSLDCRSVADGFDLQRNIKRGPRSGSAFSSRGAPAPAPPVQRTPPPRPDRSSGIALLKEVYERLGYDLPDKATAERDLAALQSLQMRGLDGEELVDAMADAAAARPGASVADLARDAMQGAPEGAELF